MRSKYFLYIFIFSLITVSGFSGNNSRDIILKSAGEIIKSSKYCTLISISEDGYSNARVMDPFPPDREWVIWMGTNLHSRKVKEILNNSKISVFYEAANGDGYVTLKGTGTINNEEENKIKYFKKGWKEFYPGDKKNFTLIKFIPKILEIVSYKNGLLGEKVTWAAPSVKLKNK